MNPLLPLVNLNEQEQIIIQSQRAEPNLNQSSNDGFKQAMDSQTKKNKVERSDNNTADKKPAETDRKDNSVEQSESDNAAKEVAADSKSNDTSDKDSDESAGAQTDAAKDKRATSLDENSADTNVDEAEEVALTAVDVTDDITLNINTQVETTRSPLSTGINASELELNSNALTASAPTVDRVLSQEAQTSQIIDPQKQTLTHSNNVQIASQQSTLDLQSKALTPSQFPLTQSNTSVKQNLPGIDSQPLVEKNVVILEPSDKPQLKADTSTSVGVSNMEKNLLLQKDVVTVNNELTTSLKDGRVESSLNKNVNIHAFVNHTITGSGTDTSNLLSSKTGRVQLPVNITFGQSGWSNMVAERSAMMASQNIKFAELQLDPPELGPLQVKVSVSQDQASVSFVATNAQVRDSLDQAQARLRELLDEQGLNLVNVDISGDSSDQFDSQQEGEGGHTKGQLASSTQDEDTDVSSIQIHHEYGVDHYV